MDGGCQPVSFERQVLWKRGMWPGGGCAAGSGGRVVSQTSRRIQEITEEQKTKSFFSFVMRKSALNSAILA